MWWLPVLGGMLLSLAQSWAQLVQTRPTEGIREKPVRFLALTNLTVVPRPGQKLERATVVIREDRIVAVGVGIPIPAGASVRECSGMWLYPAFIEPYYEVPLPPARGVESEEEVVQTPPPEGNRHWNQAVRPERRVVEQLEIEAKRAEELRGLGFALLHCGSREGIFRGFSALVLTRAGKGAEIALRSDVAQWIGFRKGKSRTPYPSSLMGALALVRQTLADAQWYRQAWEAYRRNPHQPRPEVNISLDALATALRRQLPFVVETENELTLLRALRLMQEFGLPALFVGSGREYRRLPWIARFRPRLILPIAFPDVPDVSTPEKAADITLEELKHWDAAPQNPFWVDSAGIRFALTTHGLREKTGFWDNLRRALQRGLSPESALAALTTVPAEFLGIAELVGTIEPGKLANLLLCDGELFEEETTIRSVFVAGEEFPQVSEPFVDTRGIWSLTIEGLPVLQLRLEGKPTAPEASLRRDTLRLSVQWTQERHKVAFSFAADTFGIAGIVRLSGTVDRDTAAGTALLPDGREVRWSARRDSAFVPKSRLREQKREFALAPRTFPDGPFGLVAPPPQRTVLFRNATVWTCTPAGVLRNTDVLIRAGKIAAIGPNLSVQADTIIDATGKHLTPGIIDEHSHIAIEGGVNEATHAVTAEVRIGDVVDPDDINIYRQLAGGVTAAHLLHGSANPIGGQCQLVKLRWGADAEEMKFEGAPATIKFALGENVKQSNWGDRYTSRYPQTRLGVEEIMRDAFQAAREYEAAWKRWESLPERERQRTVPPRRDFQLEALLEILRGKRLIHCHSYVQSEILMLMRLAEEFGFRVNVFTHVLEGYKVARELAQHGAGASTFSDWWAYKFEVYDATPYNAALMYEQGVLVAINSDDAEMGRRLNQEAGKTVKYGGVPEEEALKFITLNPARMLRVDHRVGSIEVGKDADLVLWSEAPLSSKAVVEQTYVDGRLYFDRRLDEQLRQRDARLRRELEQRALRALREGGKPSPPALQKRRLYHCEEVGDEVQGYEED